MNGTGAVRDGQDPMLQGTYMQDDTSDFPTSSKELDDFEARLTTGQQSGQPARQQRSRRAPGTRPHPSAAAAAATKQRPCSGGRPPMRASFDSAADAAKPSRGFRGPTKPSKTHEGEKGITEDEQEQQAERQEDINEVRHLGDNGMPDTDSD